MLWLVLNDSSHQIVSCNLHVKDNVHEAWVERINGKGLKVLLSENKEEVLEIKSAIDYAIKNNKQTLELNL